MKTKLIKFVLAVILLFAGLFGSIWVFNHVNAWLGILAVIIVVVLFLIKIIDKFKFNSNEKK